MPQAMKRHFNKGNGRPRLTASICAMIATATLSGCSESPAPEKVPTQEDLTATTAGFEPGARLQNPPTAVRQTHDLLLDDISASRHISDGKGEAWIESGPTEIVASGRGTWTFRFRASEYGIVNGGSVFVMASPYWGWSRPQTQSPRMAGFVSVRALNLEDDDPLVVQVNTFGDQLCQLAIAGRDLAPGEVLEFTYGQGDAGAVADQYAERGSRFWFSVDGDGDGVRGILTDSPSIEILPAPPASLQLHLPSTVRAGETAMVTLALVDHIGNGFVSFEGELLLQSDRRWPGLPERVALKAADQGKTQIPLLIALDAPIGTLRVAAAAVGTCTQRGLGQEDPEVFEVGGEGRELFALSNPMRILEPDSTSPSVLWADLHGHSNLSDGTGTPDDYFDYARYIAGLDIAALTDHDHWGVEFLDAAPEMWDRIVDTVKRKNAPGDFSALLAFEWTSWLHGHRHVVYFEDHGEIYSSVDEKFDDPDELWAALKGQAALTFAHHSAGGPIATNWSFPPDPILEPVTEVSSVHGSSEAWDSPSLIYRPLKGNFVRDVLDVGYKLGFIGSGDSHDGHPGLAQIASPTSGIAAILAKDNTREAILEALRARRAYATNGPRIVLDLTLGGREMGSTTVAAELEDGSALLAATVLGTAPLTRVEIIRSGEVTQILDAAMLGQTSGAEPHWSGEIRIDNLQPGEYVYLRVVQRGAGRSGSAGVAWSSPWFFE